jgi:hypothetical protein
MTFVLVHKSTWYVCYAIFGEKSFSRAQYVVPKTSQAYGIFTILNYATLQLSSIKKCFGFLVCHSQEIWNFLFLIVV